MDYNIDQARNRKSFRFKMNEAFFSKSWPLVNSYVIYCAETEFGCRQLSFCVLEGINGTNMIEMEMTSRI